MKALAPEVVIPRRLDQLPTLDAVVGGQLGVIAQIGKAYPRPQPAILADRIVRMLPIHIRIVRPHPGRKKHIQPEALGMARRDIDQQPQNLPMRHRLEMLAHALDVPIAAKRRRLDPAPRLLGELNNEPSNRRL